MMNPAALMKLMNAKNTFTKNHPKVESFVKNVIMGGGGIPAETIIEVTITKPGEEPVTTNLKVLQSDLDLLESLKDLS